MSLLSYQSFLSQYLSKESSLRKRLGWLSFVRLVLFIVFVLFVYKTIQGGQSLYIGLSIFLLATFLIAIRLYNRMQNRSAFYKALIKINKDEINFLSGQTSVYDNGKEYTDEHHPYSYDLNFFGEAGLFAYLNRTSTQFGKTTLAQTLLQPDASSIEKRQEAIKELKDKIEFRQHLQAYGMIQEPKEEELSQLTAWINSPSFFNRRTLYYVLFLFPLAAVGLLVSYIVSGSEKILILLSGIFILNLAISFLFARRISLHLSVSTSVTRVLQQFSIQLKEIEKQNLQSALLTQLQENLTGKKYRASQSIARLASLFNYLEMAMNILTSIVLNGFFLFHVHILFGLESWKKKHGSQIALWLQSLGEVESLNSLANFSFNNSSFCYPRISKSETLIADEMGHPLIPADKRISNNMAFDQQKMVILTGSNMSGKSTFLRTVGTNLILAKTGSPVCASRFLFYPFDVYVSMSISDSLKDSESFFYAELKRLQNIIEQLKQGKRVFVVLDEILRGTNSNDKHAGTVGLIRKLVEMKASGIIATHDLTVSELANEFPGYIINKCLESEIVNSELFFDYKIREGVCTTLTASYLMKKMGIVDK